MWARQLFAVLAVLVVAVALGPATLDHADTPPEVPFRVHIGTHVASAPIRLRVEARYDAERVIGGLCLVVDGEGGYHTSCWEVMGVGAPLRVVTITLTKPGEYSLQLQQVSGNGKRLSNVETILLQ